MDGSFSIFVQQPSGENVILSFYTGKAFRKACQRLLSQSDTFRRTLQTSYYARFELAQALSMERARTQCEHGASAPRTAQGAMPPPRVIRGEIERMAD
jgi:hypothetical protein